jgi:putative ABC transport system permease protein
MRFWRRTTRKPATAEFDRELQFHLDELIGDKIAQGMPPEQARREAILEFGGREQLKEELRDVHRLPVIDAVMTHLRSSFRTLRAKPAFAFTVIGTLALGIGANTAVFSAIDAVLLRPLPYPNSNRLVVLHELRPKQKDPETPVAPVRLEDWNRLNHTFQAISGYYTEDTTDVTGGFYTEKSADPTGHLPVKITRAFVAPRFLQVLGVAPILGHDFTRADEHFQGYAPQSVIISDQYWRQHFDANPRVIGKPLVPGKSSATIIGVMPRGFAFPSEDVQLWYMVPPDAPYARLLVAPVWRRVHPALDRLHQRFGPPAR